VCVSLCVKTSNNTYRYCLDLTKLGRNRSRAMANYVISLASSPSLQSVVELSKNPFNSYHYSNCTKVVTEWKLTTTEQDNFIMKSIPPPRQLVNGVKFFSFTHDFTKTIKQHSPTLPNRTYLVGNNPVAGQLHLTAGFHVAALHFGSGDGCSPPIRLEILDGTEDKLSYAFGQLKEVLALAGFSGPDILRIIRLDSFYGRAKMLGLLYDLLNTIAVARLRSGLKVWTQFQEAKKQFGRAREYGDKYYLIPKTIDRVSTNKKTGKVSTTTQISINSLEISDEEVYQAVLGNKRQVEIRIQRWNNLIIRGTRTNRMSQKPFDLIRVLITDVKTGELVFDRQMYVAISGVRRLEIETRVAYEQYRERFEVENFYRFSNTKLLMSHFQTSDISHLKVWSQMVVLASWLLFVASEEINQVQCEEWQKYDPKHKQTLELTTTAPAESPLAVSELAEAETTAPIVTEVALEVIEAITEMGQEEIELMGGNKGTGWEESGDKIVEGENSSSDEVSQTDPGTETQSKRKRISLSQTQKSLAPILCTFDKTPFAPQKSKEGEGRIAGTSFTPRERHKVYRKAELVAMKKEKESQNDDSS
jgi:hypothetical protein